MPDMVKELNETLAILSRFTLSGDAVDLMAAAKQKIRRVIAELSKEEKQNGND